MPDTLSAPRTATDVPSAASIRRQIVQTRFGQVHVRLAGAAEESARPPLVLLHMTPLSGAMHDPLLPLLGSDRLVIAPDRLGFGFSDVPERQLSVEEYAECTLDVLDALGIAQADVLGTHTGSVEATELAIQQPDRVRRVALVGVPAYTQQELEDRRYRFSGPPLPAEDGSHLIWHWQRRFLYRSPPWDLPLFQWRLLQELLAGEHGWWAYKAVFEYPMAERLLSLRQPLLVLAPHDDLWEQTRRAQLPRGAKFVELEHLGLDIAYYATDEVAEHIRAFLDD